MLQHELRQPKGAKRARKRVGRGNASGHGTYATRGMKGAKARSGWRRKPGFEGGQTPLFRRLKYRRGFNNKWRVEFAEVNVARLARLPAGSEVTPESLRRAGVVKGRLPVKVLGQGDLAVPLTVTADRFSASARAKIEQAGGRVIETMPSKRAARPAAAEEPATEAAAAAEAPAAPQAAPSEATEPPPAPAEQAKPKRTRARKAAAPAAPAEEEEA